MTETRNHVAGTVFCTPMDTENHPDYAVAVNGYVQVGAAV